MKNILLLAALLSIPTITHTKLIPRTYNEEATKKLRAALEVEAKSPDDITSAYLQSIKQLIEAGADPNIILKTSDGTQSMALILMLTPLPSMKEDIDLKAWEDVLIAALTHGANPNVIEPSSGNKAIFYMLKKGSPRLVKTFLDHGATLDLKNEHDNKFIQGLHEQLKDQKEWLQSSKDSIPNKKASIKKEEELLKKIASKPVRKFSATSSEYNTDATNKLQKLLDTTPNLLYAAFAQKEFLQEIENLINQGANPNLTLIEDNEKIENIIIKYIVFAPIYNDLDNFEQLETTLETALKHGANPNVYVSNNTIPLIFRAITFDSPKMIDLLFEHGADKKLKDNKGNNLTQYIQSNIDILQKVLNDTIHKTIPEIEKEIDRVQKIIAIIESQPERKILIK